jgi:prophage regulatory protein
VLSSVTGSTLTRFAWLVSAEVLDEYVEVLRRCGVRRSLRLLRFSAVRARTGLSRSMIWRLEQCGAFPKHRRISANTVAWVEGEVMSWIQSKIDPIAV